MNREKLQKMAGSVRTGGKGSVRRWVNLQGRPQWSALDIMEVERLQAVATRAADVRVCAECALWRGGEASSAGKYTAAQTST